MDRLILWLPDPLDGAWPWYVSPNKHGLARTPDEKAALADLGTQETTVILPGSWARTFALDLPKMRPRERIAAAGFSIEDRLGTGLKGQHVALQGGGESLRAGVIHIDKMIAVVSALSAMGLASSHIYVDFDVCTPHGASIALADRVIRCGPGGFAIDPEQYKALALGPEPRQGDLVALSSTLNTGDAINFVQGAFAPRRQMFQYGDAAMRSAAALACLGAVFLAWQGTLAWAAGKQADHVNVQTLALYENATGKKPRGSAALAVTRALKTGSAGPADFLALSNIFLTAAAQIDSVTVDMVQYDARQARLSVRLIYPSLASAAALEKAIASQGGRFRPGGVREVDGQMVGDGVVTAGGAS